MLYHYITVYYKAALLCHCLCPYITLPRLHYITLHYRCRCPYNIFFLFANIYIVLVVVVLVVSTLLLLLVVVLVL